MKDRKVIISVVLMIAAIAICIAGMKFRGEWNVQTPSTAGAEIGRTVFMEITHKWSPEIDLGISTPKYIEWGAMKDNVPITVMINGGKENGGYEFDTPARQDLERLGEKPPAFPHEIIRIKFRLAAGSNLDKAQLAYCIK